MIDLDRIYETFIKIPIPFSWDAYINVLRTKVSPLISNLYAEKVIKWYCFLLHDRKSGVPTTEDDTVPYIHIRLEVNEREEDDKLYSMLPPYCVMTRKIPRTDISQIAGIDKSLLKNFQIEEAWNILGESSVWILKMLEAHSSCEKITIQQIAQFLHYFSNALQVRVG